MEEVWNRLKKYDKDMTKNNEKELEGPRFKVGDLVLVSNRAYSSKFRKDQMLKVRGYVSQWDSTERYIENVIDGKGKKPSIYKVTDSTQQFTEVDILFLERK